MKNFPKSEFNPLSLGYLLFKDYCENVSENPINPFRFYEEIKSYEKLRNVEDRRKQAREVYDNFIMNELLSHTHVSRCCFKVKKLIVSRRNVIVILSP